MTASWITIAVIFLRAILKKAPKTLTVFLWALVGIRLICPISLESGFSLIPSTEVIPDGILYDSTPAIHTGIPVINTAVNPWISDSFAPNIGDSVNPLQIIAFCASILWVIGFAAMLVYAAVSYLKISRKVRESALIKDNIRICDRVDSPFILGIFRPRIYLPSVMNEADMAYVIAHEKAHLQRRDHLWKPLGFLLLAIYWFNPVLWVAYILLCRDIELACDEKVIHDLGSEIKKPYSDALINCSLPRKMISVCPLAFGEVNVKGRVKSVLNYKKPAFWLIVIAVIVSIAAAVCLLTDPINTKRDMQDDSYYLVINEDGVMSIEISTPLNSGGCINADGSPFQKGDTVLLEHLDGITNLQGVSIAALDKDGNIIHSFSIPKDASDAYIQNTVVSDGWVIMPDTSLSIIGGADGPTTITLSGKQLTLDDVIRLSKKGNKLKWDDFKKYSYTEIGSGLYIRQYVIDEMFTLWIGGTNTNDHPMYFYLHANDAWDEEIDIRTGDVEAFIDQHKNNAVVKKLSVGYYACPVDKTGENYANMTEIGGVPPSAHLSSIRFLPTVKITSVSQLEAFKNKMKDAMDFDLSTSDALSFNEIIKDYDDAHFQHATLYLIYATAHTKETYFTLEYAKSISDGLFIGIMESIPEPATETKQGWLVCINVPHTEATGIRTVDAMITGQTYPLSGMANAKVLRIYSFKDSKEEIIKPSFILYDNGEFNFTFSGYSSYVGFGYYELNEDRLTLKTADNRFIYCFDVKGDTMVFDADASSDMLWYSDMYDGCIFE